jgi:hypothetical protein
VYKGCENYVKEDAFVVIKENVKSTEYFGVIRSPRMYDPLLSHYQRSSMIEVKSLGDYNGGLCAVDSDFHRSTYIDSVWICVDYTGS